MEITPEIKFSLIIIMNLIFVIVFSQSPSNPTEYGNWEYIYNGDISNDGKWFHYITDLQTATDTLTVTNISSKKSYKIPGGHEGRISKNSRFFTSFVNKNQLQIIDLQKDTVTILENIRNRGFSSDERFLILSQTGAENSNLLIKHLGLGTEISIPQVVEYKINALKNEVAIIMNNEGEFSLNVLDLNSYTLNSIRNNSDYQYSNPTWSEDGLYLAVVQSRKDPSLKEQKILRCFGLECTEISLETIPTFPNVSVEDNSLEISSKGDLVYFKCATESNSHDPITADGVQVWKTTDKWIYPRKEINNLLKPQPNLWVWKSSTGKVNQISDSLLTEVIKINKDYILKYDQLAYEPQYEYVPNVDLYLHNLNTNRSQLLLKKQKPDQVFISPEGNNIVFFKNHDWWVYNLIGRKFINLSQSLPVSFLNVNSDNDSKKIPFSKRIKWVEGENAILVGDEFDVWLLGLEGKTKKRLTHGREIKRNYNLFMDFLNHRKIPQNIVNLQTGFLLQATDENRNTGYFLWQSHGNLKPLSFGPFLADQIKWDEKLNFFTFKIQSYNVPPKILSYNRASNTIDTLIQSNINQKLKQWGKAVLFPFTMSNGEKSKVCLIYPANYDPAKTYPMIVDIYEKKTLRMHDFFPISWYSEIGFNPTQYSLDGYFILMPDIAYEIGNVGLSANKYVNESVDFVLEIENIDKNKIGIIGHSFGGYEAAFIVTQTDRFAAAVAGAAVTDMVTFYHTINWNSGWEEMFRFENYQMRMGGSYFDLKRNYINNSPFHNIENISTPLLLWSGGNDLHINFHESIRLYLALRRLKKNAELLLFENEEHTLTQLKNKTYLSNTIKKYFDKYCK